jgi:hypothetical protein
MSVGFYLISVLINGVLVGAGMGVPIFCILMGAPYGFLVAGKILKKEWRTHRHYHFYSGILKASAILAVTTFIFMLIIWTPWVVRSFDPGFDYKNTGMPLILYTLKPSFWGWITLMIIISPVLQFMTSVSAGVASVYVFLKKQDHGDGHGMQTLSGR